MDFDAGHEVFVTGEGGVERGLVAVANVIIGAEHDDFAVDPFMESGGVFVVHGFEEFPERNHGDGAGRACEIDGQLAVDGGDEAVAEVELAVAECGVDVEEFFGGAEGFASYEGAVRVGFGGGRLFD